MMNELMEVEKLITVAIKKLQEEEKENNERKDGDTLHYFEKINILETSYIRDILLFLPSNYSITHYSLGAGDIFKIDDDDSTRVPISLLNFDENQLVTFYF
jgi:hypothetical protein